MKTLDLNITYNGKLKSIIDSSLKDIYDGVEGKFLTLELENELNFRLTGLLTHKLKDLGELDFKILIDVEDGILQFTPGNLFTLCAFNGYFVDPKLITRDLEEIRIGTNTFKIAPRAQYNG
jgi:hypothetical protein